MYIIYNGFTTVTLPQLNISAKLFHNIRLTSCTILFYIVQSLQETIIKEKLGR